MAFNFIVIIDKVGKLHIRNNIGKTNLVLSGSSNN